MGFVCVRQRESAKIVGSRVLRQRQKIQDILIGGFFFDNFSDDCSLFVAVFCDVGERDTGTAFVINRSERISLRSLCQIREEKLCVFICEGIIVAVCPVDRVPLRNLRDTELQVLHAGASSHVFNCLCVKKRNVRTERAVLQLFTSEKLEGNIIDFLCVCSGYYFEIPRICDGVVLTDIRNICLMSDGIIQIQISQIPFTRIGILCYFNLSRIFSCPGVKGQTG